MPIYRRLPKRGFTQIFRKDYAELNLDRLQDAITSGNLNANEPINLQVLVASGVISKPLDGVRLLGGEL